MQTLIVKTESEAAAKLLLAFLKTVRLVKSITFAPDEKKAGMVSEPAEEYNWINPSRPATYEEIERMLDECETQFKSGDVFTIEEAEEKTRKKIAAWKKHKISK